VELTRCPTCDHGIKPTRGWTWVDVGPLLGPAVALCSDGESAEGAGRFAEYGGASRGCHHCPANLLRGKHGLLWIGEQFYPTPEHWLQEVRAQGISRRIVAVPKAFKLGETWVLAAHRKAIRNSDGTYTPGIFQLFRPSAVEYVVKGSETPEELAALEKRGITPVAVQRDDGGLFPVAQEGVGQ
jgi:hypothetical protein